MRRSGTARDVGWRRRWGAGRGGHHVASVPFLITALVALVLAWCGPAAAQRDELGEWLYLLETHQHRLLGERLRSDAAREHPLERLVVMAAMGGADLLLGRSPAELHTLTAEALPGLAEALKGRDVPGPALWRALGLRTLAAAATLRGEKRSAERWRKAAAKVERRQEGDPDVLLGIGADHFARWCVGDGQEHLAAARQAFEEGAAGGGGLAGTARILATHAAREEGDWQGVLALGAAWEEVRHPLAFWSVGWAERRSGEQAATSQEAMLHLSRSAKYFSRLRFQVRSIAWPHYEQGLTLLAMAPHQRNDADRFRTLEAAQHAFEAYLATRDGDGTRRADGHFRLGQIAEQRGQRDAARDHYRLASAAGHGEAGRRLAALERGE